MNTGSYVLYHGDNLVLDLGFWTLVISRYQSLLDLSCFQIMVALRRYYTMAEKVVGWLKGLILICTVTMKAWTLVHISNCQALHTKY